MKTVISQRCQFHGIFVPYAKKDDIEMKRTGDCNEICWICCCWGTKYRLWLSRFIFWHFSADELESLTPHQTPETMKNCFITASHGMKRVSRTGPYRLQLLRGPDVVGPYGLLQSIAHVVKLFTKEPLWSLISSKFIFIIAPILAPSLTLTIWIPLPIPYPLINISLGVLFILAMSSLPIYSILWSGWALNSKCTLIKALCTVAQKIWYKVTLAMIFL